MYSMILMSALAAGPDVPANGGLFSSCHGCCGGSCSGAYTAASCHGCCGGGWFSGERVRAFFSLFGGCCGGSCCGGCCGGYSSGFATTCTGCCGGRMMPAMPMGPVYDGGAMPYGTIPLPAGPLPGGYDVPPASPRPAPPPTVDELRGFHPQLPAPPGLSPRATVTVRLPADARLFAEGQPMTHAGGEKTFVTPELPPGRDFTYTFRAEYARDGEKVMREKQLSVRPGGTYAVEFDEKVAKPNTTEPTGTKKLTPEGEKTSYAGIPPAAFPLAALTGGKDPATLAADPVAPAAAKDPDRARITVKLPAGATLYVDGKKNAKTDPTREFVTPPLAFGKEYTYTMTAELGGPAGTVTHKVAFRAGESVTVDFTATPPAPGAMAAQPGDALAAR
jgi:uncharacterized protein (TIGR03000 family)